MGFWRVVGMVVGLGFGVVWLLWVFVVLVWWLEWFLCFLVDSIPGVRLDIDGVLLCIRGAVVQSRTEEDYFISWVWFFTGSAGVTHHPIIIYPRENLSP